MCGNDADHPSVQSMKCKAIAPMVFAVFNILGLGNIVLSRWVGPSVAGGLAGILCAAASSMTCGCVLPPGVGAQQTAKISRIVGILASVSCVLYLAHSALWVVEMTNSMACANADCSNLQSAMVPEGCIQNLCEEKDYPLDGWQDDDDCMAADLKSRCAAPSDGSTIYHFVSDKPTYTWDCNLGGCPAGKAIGCAPVTCCSTSSTPPAGFVDGATAGECTDGEAWDHVFCQWKEICQFGMYIAIGGIGWALLCLVLTFIFALSAFGAAKRVQAVGDLGNGGVSTAAHAQAMPVAIATAVAMPVGKTPEI